MNQDTFNETATIPTQNLSVLRNQIAKVNRRATKLGLAPLTYTCSDPILKVETYQASSGSIRRRKSYTDVAIQGVMPHLPGWRLVACIDQASGSHPIVNAVPSTGIEIPKSYREQAATCDHCNLRRNRREVFLLWHEDEGFKVVGRQCMADFLGLSSEAPEHILMMLSWVRSIKAACEDSLASYRISFDGYPTEDVVAYGLAFIDMEGWKAVSSGADYPTVSRVIFAMNPPAKIKADEKAMLLEARERKEALVDEAKAAMEWAAGHAGTDNDFMHKLALVAQMETADRYLSMAVCIGMAYRKHLDRLRRYEFEAKQTSSSQFVGTVKVRQEMTLTLISVRAFEGNYGVTFISKFVDDAGNAITWWASRDVREDGWKIDETKKVKATVKKHEEFKGTKQTTVNRVTPIGD